jgi:photosystem II stability/assembly factor-like uncharacterized protein
MKALSYMIVVLLLAAGTQEKGIWSKVKQLPEQYYEPFVVDSHKKGGEPKPILARPVITALHFTNSSTGWAVGYTGTFLHTIDGGSTWQDVSGYPKINYEGIYLSSENEGWIVGNSSGKGSVLHFEDGGAKYLLQTQINGWLKSISFTDNQKGWIAGLVKKNNVSGAAILATEDGGRHWELQYFDQALPNGIHKVQFVDSYNGWAISDETIIHTKDGGKTWLHQYESPAAFFRGIDFINASEGLIVGIDGIVLHTMNGGKNWRESKVPFPTGKSTRPWLTCVKLVSGKTYWVGGTDGQLLYTEDHGRSWKLEEVKDAGTILSLVINPKDIFAVTGKGLIIKRAGQQ